MKKINVFIIYIFMVICTLFAETHAMNSTESPLKVLFPPGAFWIKNHWQDNEGLALVAPVHWRSSIHAKALFHDQGLKINQYGIDTLFISGSAAPSFGNMQWLKKKAGIHPVYLIDLRQEIHLYLNYLPVSLFYKRDEINWGKSSQAINQDEASWIGFFKQSGLITVNKLGKPLGGFKVPQDPVILPVKKMNTEQHIAEKAELKYFRIEVPDYHPPTPAQVDQFIQIIKKAPANVWLHMHCAAGNGRTTTFMVMRDILANAQQVSLHDIIARQAALGGINLFEVSSSLISQPWKKEYHQARIDYIKLFYSYIHSKAHLEQCFSNWVMKQPDSPYKHLLKTEAYYH